MRSSRLQRIRDLIHRESRIPFYKQIDLYGLEDGILIGVTGALGLGFRLEGRDLLLQSEEEINDFERRARKFLNALPEGVMLHFIVRNRAGDEETLRDYLRSVEPEGDLMRKLTEAKVRSFRENPCLKRDIFLFVVIHPKGKRPRSSFLPDLSLAFGKKARKLSELEYRASQEALRAVSVDIKEGLEEFGFHPALLREQEILQYLYELLNPGYVEEIAPFPWDFFRPGPNETASISLRSLLLMTPPIAEERFFYLSHFFHKAVNLLKLPEATDLKTMKDFEGGLGKDYLLSVTIEAADQAKLKSKIKRQGNYSKARNFFSPSKDHDAIEAAGETDEFLTALAESSDKLFYTWFAILVKDRSLDGAARRAHAVLKNFPRLGGAQAIEDHMNHDRDFLSFLPLQGDDNPLYVPVRSEALVHLLPLQSGWRGTGGGGLLLKTYRDEPLRLDVFDPRLQAKHAVMIGTTGSGKSFFTTHLLLHFLIESPTHEVVVIDLGGSYRKLASVMGGAYLEVECSERFALNPFPRKEILFPDVDEADATFLQFLKELLQKMIGPERIWTASEKMILERAISEAYRPLAPSVSPLLGDIERVLRNFTFTDEEDREKAYRFAKELALFTQGEYGKILNRKGVFDFDSRFTVFDLRRISQYPELQEIFLLIIPFALKRKFENLNLKKILVLDECWQLLKESQGTELVEVFYRTARKFNAGVLSISQNPEDFLDAKISSVIINNSPVKYILRLKKGYDKLALFGLNPNETRAVSELEVRPGYYSEVFIKFDERPVIARLEPSALEYWIATTDAFDLAEELALKESHTGLTQFEVLEKLAQEYPNGVKKTRETQHAG